MLKFMMAKAAGKKGELFLYGDIGGWFDGPSTASINQEMQAIGAVDELNIYINSAGGSIVDGMGIYSMLSRHKARKIVHIDYLAASIASVIAMAGDEIRIAGNGRIMIHRASGGAFGNPDEMVQAAEALRGMEEDIVKTYVTRTGQKAEEIRTMLAAETWMDAEKAKALGFVDSIEQLQSNNRIETNLLNKYRNVPGDLRPAPTINRMRLAEIEAEAVRIKNRASPAAA